MIDLSRRSEAAELMDATLADPDDYAACLSDLARVNRVTRTHAPVLAWLAKTVPPRSGFRLLDVACGHGDLLRAISRWAARRGLAAELEGIDLNPKGASAAAAATPPDMAIRWRTGDVFAYAPQPRPDFIVSSQFTHHLDRAELVRFLQWIDQHAARAWCITDLQRHVLAYHGFRALSWAARWHPIVRYDGAISVARGFRRAEWHEALKLAGVEARVTWRLPFRFTVSREKA